jgi:hypothetical protein
MNGDSMSKYATVIDGTVTDVSLWDGVSAWQPQQGVAVQIPDDVPAGIGWGYDGGTFVAPPQPEPVPPTFEEVQAARHAAYVEQSDPVFFRWQRGQATEQDWLAAVAAVDAAHPYPAPL